MTQEQLEKYGNELTIQGMVLANGIHQEIIMLPENNFLVLSDITAQFPTEEELKKIFFQLDVLEITDNQKVILRKSQRNLDAVISWNVFRRDHYTCVYCGNSETPLTVDHLVLWEDMGDSVEGNLVTACKKCNHTRGRQQLPDFLNSPYYDKVKKPHLFPDKENLLKRYEYAKTLPLRKPRSR